MNNIKDKVKKVMKSTGLDKAYEPIRRRREENMMARKISNLKENGLRLLQIVKNEFDENNLEFWLDFGTLLGAFRDKDFISHDFDIDISMKDSVDKKIVESLLLKKGIIKVSDFILDGETVEQTYEYKGISMDIFYASIDQDRIHAYIFYLAGDKCVEYKNEYSIVKGWKCKRSTSTYTGFDVINFKGMEFIAPKDIELYLSENYGEDYMIPKKEWDYVESPTNLEEIEAKDIVRYEYSK